MQSAIVCQERKNENDILIEFALSTRILYRESSSLAVTEISIGGKTMMGKHHLVRSCLLAPLLVNMSTWMVQARQLSTGPLLEGEKKMKHVTVDNALGHSHSAEMTGMKGDEHRVSAISSMLKTGHFPSKEPKSNQSSGGTNTNTPVSYSMPSKGSTVAPSSKDTTTTDTSGHMQQYLGMKTPPPKAVKSSKTSSPSSSTTTTDTSGHMQQFLGMKTPPPKTVKATKTSSPSSSTTTTDTSGNMQQFLGMKTPPPKSVKATKTSSPSSTSRPSTSPTSKGSGAAQSGAAATKAPKGANVKANKARDGKQPAAAPPDMAPNGTSAAIPGTCYFRFRTHFDIAVNLIVSYAHLYASAFAGLVLCCSSNC
jgi:hypothetical protein